MTDERFECELCGEVATSVNAISKGFFPTGNGRMLHSCCISRQNEADFQRIERGLRAVLDEMIGEPGNGVWRVKDYISEKDLPRLVEIFQKAATP